MQNADDATAAATPGVTVVVPAYNPGRYLERCLESLLDQTLERSRYDVVVVDDGSTDGSDRRLDRFAAKHPGLVRVEHIANSGWPGRPRNLGTDLARGDYVFYCDADDWLLPHALEVMLDQAVAHDADVLLARPVGNGRNVGLAIYEIGDVCTSARETPAVFSTLTCQKLFRREFLRERQVRFPEGRVRLEDFLFMTAAYLRAERISIVGSQPCYVFEKRDDGGGLTSTTATEADYFGSVGKIIDLVLAETTPGPEQDRLLDRVVRSELINPLSRPSLLRKSPAVQAEALELGRDLLRTKVPASAVARQDPVTRHRARSIELGHLAAIRERIEAEQSVAQVLTVTGARWEGTALHVDLRLALELDRAALVLTRDGSQLHLPGPLAGDDPVDVSRLYTGSSAQIHLRSRDRSEEWRVSARLQPVPGDDGPRLEWTGSVALDAWTAAGGSPMRTGVWDVHVALASCGFRRNGRLHAAPDVDVDVDPAPPVTQQGLRVRPYWTQRGALALTVRSPADVDRVPDRRTTGLRRIARALVSRGRRRAVRRALRRAVARARRSLRSRRE